MHRSKLTRDKLMRRSKDVARYLPETKRMTKRSLWKMVSVYGGVFLKPAFGTWGKGIIQLQRLGNNRYEVHRENKKQQFKGKKLTYAYIKQLIGNKPYLVQQRISLLKVNKRPFDIRVVVQRKTRSTPWQVTGKIARMAGKGYIVTNITRNGKNLDLMDAIEKSSLSKQVISPLLSEIDTVSLKLTEVLSKKYPWKRIFGYDLGIDVDGQLWIIEANPFPMIKGFRTLKDRSMYRRIKKFKKKCTA